MLTAPLVVSGVLMPGKHPGYDSRIGEELLCGEVTVGKTYSWSGPEASPHQPHAQPPALSVSLHLQAAISAFLFTLYDPHPVPNLGHLRELSISKAQPPQVTLHSQP